MNEEKEEFVPAEAVELVDSIISQITIPVIGFLFGVIYMYLTLMLAFLAWFSLTAMMVKTDAVFTRGVNVSVIAFTIGSFVLITASNLTDHYTKKNLNFRGYVHNSITFIAAGIAFMMAFIYKSFVLTAAISLVGSVLSLVYVGLVGIGSLLLTLSIWILLKLLWRLNQLIKWKRDYELDRPLYSELVSFFGGFYVGVVMDRDELEEMIQSETEEMELKETNKSVLFISAVFIYSISIGVIIVPAYVVLGWGTPLKILLIIFGGLGLFSILRTSGRTIYHRWVK